MTETTLLHEETEHDLAVVHHFEFDRIYELAGKPFGVRPGTCSVTVDSRHLEITFGHWQLETSVANIASASVTGPYTIPRTIGPPHLSLRDRGLTFATNQHEGVCIRFLTPVAGIEPLHVLRHPAVTVTVNDAPGLAELLNELAGRPRDVAEVIEELHDELASLTTAELRVRARDLGVQGVSKMTKAQLLAVLDESPRDA